MSSDPIEPTGPGVFLDRIEVLAASATPGPWHVEESRWNIPGCTEVDQIVCGPRPTAGVPRDGIADVFDGHWVDGEGERPDAPNLHFIAASRYAVPRLAAALRAVLALHQPTGVVTSGGTDRMCRECRNHPMTERDIGWPCATYRTISAALEGDSKHE